MSEVRRPLVGVVSDRRELGPHPFHMVGEKYLSALVNGARVYPVALPLLAKDFNVLEIFDRLDGLFLPGSPSNVDPRYYRGEASEPGTWHDLERDASALEMIPAAIRLCMPVFAVCRGLQEMNVAFGGTLHQKVHEVPGYNMHKENPDDPVEQQYQASHEVLFEPGGLLERITGEKSARVNSLHSQGVDKLGQSLEVEARAKDGLIEAFRVRGAPGFTLAVQWHPEWAVLENPVSLSLFRAFGNACRAYKHHDYNTSRVRG
jgi:putative glutamine amidotransferase